ncbi:hypothetical protein GGI12_001480 [Dipsacomyces acuminosporus]|nr:hypothetical protein GGI12_001480 [Dipsacomyces acuminosporus]
MLLRFPTFTTVVACIALVAAAIPDPSTRYWLSQPVDHSGSNSRQWRQQYLVNATFYKSGGPIYVRTSGEHPLSNDDTDATYFRTLAQRTNGLIVAIEHRFYGESHPMPDLSGPSLRYLTLENVLEDFASFIKTAKSNPSQIFPVTVAKNSKVIFFGASYAGAIAAWMRAKYPELVSGAWASSAIVYARLNYFQADQMLGKRLARCRCGDGFSQAVEDLDAILLSGNATAIAQVQQKFGSPQLTARDFAGLVSGLTAISFNDPITTRSDPLQDTVCSYFASNDASPLDAYANAIKGAIERNKLTPEMLYLNGNTSLALDNYALLQEGRVWYYQLCTWFGDWFVAPPSGSGLQAFSSQLHDLEYWQPNCQKKFGSDIKVPVDVGSFNQKWFGILDGVGNIYYTSGSLDVWRDATVAATAGNLLKSTPNSPIVLIDGASHGQDLLMEAADDLGSVKSARIKGESMVRKWIGRP